MNNYLKKLPTLIVISTIVLFTGCQTDDEQKSQSQEKAIAGAVGVTEAYLTLNDLDALPEAKSIITKIAEQKKANPSGKSIYNPEYDFFVNTDKILRIDNGKYHSLTFPVFRLQKDNGITENLVLSSQDNGKYLVALYKYKLSNQEKTAILNNQPTDIQGHVSRTVLQNFNPDDITARIVQVFYTQILVIACGSGEHDSKNFGKWHECTVAKKPQVLAITRSVLLDVLDDVVAVGSEIGSSGGAGGSSDGYSPPPFNPGKDLLGVKSNLTRPMLGMKSIEELFYYNLLDDQEREAMQFREFRTPILKFLEENNWQTNHQEHAKQLLKYLYEGGDISFVTWALEYIKNNNPVPPDQFKNWFIGKSEGNDGDYNAAYWNNPNLSFPKQNLPSWQAFNSAYPKNANGTYMTGADNIFNYVGGAVKQARIDYPSATNNPCALKVSIALNGSGITIPELYYPNGNPITLKGANGKYYFLNAKALNSWMKETFGTNPASLTTPLNNNHYQFTNGGINGQDFSTAIEGKKGIFTMLPTNPGDFGASGHCDKYDGSECAAKCYFPHASEINIWVLD